MPQSSDNIWDQEAQSAFYSMLKTKSTDEQGEFVLTKAEELIYHENANHYLLKGAESLLNMYTLKYQNESNAAKAKELLATIYAKLGEEDKASRFLK